MIFRFGDHVLDTDRFELRRSGVVQPMEPQVFELLRYLIEQRDRVVSRDELIAAIWHGRIVADSTINSRIKAARIAVGDDGHRQAFIRTFSRRGYRFVAPVLVPAAPAAQPREITGDVATVVANQDTLDGLALDLPEQPSVAVLPLRPGDVGDHRILADGLTHDIITQLSRARWLFVVARGSAFRFDKGPYDEREVGRALGVRYVVQGEVSVRRGRLAVRIALCDAVRGAECWSERYETRLSDALELETEIADVIVGALESEVEHLERERVALVNPASLDAWGAYHRACWHMYRFAPDDYVRAEQFFELSLSLGGEASRTYAGLSFVHWQRAFLELTGDRAGDAKRARECAEQSLALDPREPHAHWALGRAYLLDGDLEQSVDELETSVALNPSSAMGHYSLSYALMQVGDAPRSNDAVAKARRLSPYDVMTFAMYAVRAQNLAFLGRYGEAADFATRAARQPNAHYHVVAIAAFCNMLSDRRDTAAEFYTRLRNTRPTYTDEDYLRAFLHQPPANVRLVRETFGALRAL